MLRLASIVEALGGRRGLGPKVRTLGDLRARADAGLPYAALESVGRKFGLDRKALGAALRIPERTLARRKRERRLRPDESDRLLRLARIGGYAARVLGSDEKAGLWLRDANPALGGEVPLDLVATDLGAQQVEEIIGRIEYGIYS